MPSAAGVARNLPQKKGIAGRGFAVARRQANAKPQAENKIGMLFFGRWFS
jgi:hypothetical protein